MSQWKWTSGLRRVSFNEESMMKILPTQFSNTSDISASKDDGRKTERKQ